MDYKERGKQILYYLFDPFISGIKSIGMTPNQVTIIGFLLNVVGALYLIGAFNSNELEYGENLFGFGIILGFAGLMDTLDGRLARVSGLKSKFGAFFDSVVDRYSEFIMFFGILVYFVKFDLMIGITSSFFALIGSIMVSYNRSRAEALGIDCSVGFMQRPERIIFIGLWAIIWGMIWRFSPHIMSFQIANTGIDWYTSGFIFLAISTNITALRRLIYSESKLRESAS